MRHTKLGASKGSKRDFDMRTAFEKRNGEKNHERTTFLSALPFPLSRRGKSLSLVLLAIPRWQTFSISSPLTHSSKAWPLCSCSQLSSSLFRIFRPLKASPKEFCCSFFDVLGFRSPGGNSKVIHQSFPAARFRGFRNNLTETFFPPLH